VRSDASTQDVAMHADANGGVGLTEVRSDASTQDVAMHADANTTNAKQCSQKSNADRRSIVLMGNPGSGKSTLLNTLMRGIHFKSGVRFVFVGPVLVMI